MNPYTSENMPFLSGAKRFRLNKSYSSEDIGPGTYDLFKKGAKTKKFNSVIAPFSSNAERKPTYFKLNNKLSPGQYELESYFDWNKKSFNAMFI